MILIRADANEIIGTGHIMRCMTMAKAFVSYRENVLFLTADHKSDELIHQNGFSTVCLNTMWTDMETECEELKKIIGVYSPDLLLIDSYFVTKNYFRFLSTLVKTAYIDDLNKMSWDVDYLINYNIFGKNYDYSGYKDSRTKLLISLEYVPLREEFCNLPPFFIKENIENILISTGGADPEGITEKIITGICPKFEKIDFHFVVGTLNNRLEEISILSSHYLNVHLHIKEKHMARLMQACDIAVSAAGSTLYELCACAVPTITYSLADNQIIAAKVFSQEEIMLYSGDARYDDQFISNLEKDLHKLEDKRKRLLLSKAMKNILPGNGANVLAEALLDRRM